MNTSETLKPPREAAEWLLDSTGVSTPAKVDLIFEMIRGRIQDLRSDMVQDHYSAGWTAAMTAVLDLLAKPEEPKDTRAALIESYADLLCAALGHEHQGRPRCTGVVLAENLLARHDRLTHPLVEVPGAFDDLKGQVSEVILDKIRMQTSFHQPTYCQAGIQDMLHGWLECERTLGHSGAHVVTKDGKAYEWTDDIVSFQERTYPNRSSLCLEERQGFTCRLWRGHGGAHEDTIAPLSPKWTRAPGVVHAKPLG